MNTLEVGKYYKDELGMLVGPMKIGEFGFHYVGSLEYFDEYGDSNYGSDPNIIPQETTTYIQLLEAIVGRKKCAAIKEIMAQ